jgi:DNA ligase-associated metallophosphoesterase
MLAPLHLGPERLMLDPAGVLAWPARRTLVVADLHLEKGSHFARGGRFVPPYDTRETLARLALALRRHAPERLVLLGDSFHDPGGPTRLAAEDRAHLLRLLAGRQVVWIAGNHDPAPPDLPGEAMAELADGPLTFRHVAAPGPVRSEVSGHYHPKATLATRAGGVSRPCFLSDGRRLMLPAFGAYTGGLDAADPALVSLFPRGARAFLLGPERLYAVPVGRGAALAAR